MSVANTMESMNLQLTHHAYIYLCHFNADERRIYIYIYKVHVYTLEQIFQEQ